MLDKTGHAARKY